MRKSFGIFLILSWFLFGCASRGVVMDLTWYIPNINAKGLVPPEGPIVSFTDPEIQQYGCLDVDEIIELKNALRRSK